MNAIPGQESEHILATVKSALQNYWKVYKFQ